MPKPVEQPASVADDQHRQRGPGRRQERAEVEVTVKAMALVWRDQSYATGDQLKLPTAIALEMESEGVVERVGITRRLASSLDPRRAR